MAELYLTHNFVAGRECGDCVMCCKVLGIDEPEFSKPKGQLCVHCTGSSCGIYETRPVTCRTFHCLWRRVDALTESHRPDLTGVIFTLEGQKAPTNPFDWLAIVARAEDVDVARYEQPAVLEQIKVFTDEGSLPVWLNTGEEKRLVWPRKEMVDALMDLDAARGLPIHAEAAAWAERYERFVAAFWEERDRAEAAAA